MPQTVQPFICGLFVIHFSLKINVFKICIFALFSNLILLWETKIWVCIICRRKNRIFLDNQNMKSINDA
eukprot:UN22055